MDRPKIQVEGHNHLFRDANTNAIINTDSSGFQQFIQARKSAQEKENKISILEQRLERLEKLLDGNSN